MNPIGQAFPVINRAYAFSSYFDQVPWFRSLTFLRCIFGGAEFWAPITQRDLAREINSAREARQNFAGIRSYTRIKHPLFKAKSERA